MSESATIQVQAPSRRSARPSAAWCEEADALWRWYCSLGAGQRAQAACVQAAAWVQLFALVCEKGAAQENVALFEWSWIEHQYKAISRPLTGKGRSGTDSASHPLTIVAASGGVQHTAAPADAPRLESKLAEQLAPPGCEVATGTREAAEHGIEESDRDPLELEIDAGRELLMCSRFLQTGQHAHGWDGVTIGGTLLSEPAALLRVLQAVSGGCGEWDPSLPSVVGSEPAIRGGIRSNLRCVDDSRRMHAAHLCVG